MSIEKYQIKSPACILCRSKFNCKNRQPCTQVCQHSICMKCISESDGLVKRCPRDNREVAISKRINHPLLIYSVVETELVIPDRTIAKTSAIERINCYLEEFAILLKSEWQTRELKPNISPQLGRQLLKLLESTYIFDESRLEYIGRAASVYKRLLIDLIQAHSNTKQREEDFRRLVKKKGCILHPDLTDDMMKILIKLYVGSGQIEDTSFERSVLIKFCLKELRKKREIYNTKQVEKVIQTLFFSGCFHVTKGDNRPSRYRLKDELYDMQNLRLKYDKRLIELAQEGRIRLSPKSWAQLLYNRPEQEDTSHLQSLLDKHQIIPTYSELESSNNRASKKCKLSQECLTNLRKIEILTNSLQASTASSVSLENLEELIGLLYQERKLFVLRQCRSQLPDLQVVSSS